MTDHTQEAGKALQDTYARIDALKHKFQPNRLKEIQGYIDRLEIEFDAGRRSANMAVDELKSLEYRISQIVADEPPTATAAPEPKAEKIDLKKFVNRLHGKSIHEEEVDALREKLEKQAVSGIVADYNDGKYEDAAGALSHLNRIIPKR